ncbi:MAG: hypothetical protein ABJX32_17855 [Tateyamaria sp.]|uniref:hypothetical protein n=1 Tax=Tateyamaria sp. TaxID=1929288 RepID=UPI0032A05C2A
MTAFRFALSLALALSSASCVRAADFKLGGDPDLSCFATLSGLILPGDADRLHAFLDQTYSANREGRVAGVSIPAMWSDFQTGARLCLNSPGGSLTEAVRMADVLLGARDDEDESLTGIGTAVPPEATCESACAILFLAGGQLISSHLGRRADRVLHVEGLLGFHAPALTVQDQTYDKSNVEAAFGIALESIAAVGTRMSFLRMRQSLLQLIIDTPPDEMSYVQTIGQAAEWNIDLAGLPALPNPSAHNLIQACFNLRRAIRPDGASIVDGTTLSNVESKGTLALQAYRYPGFPSGGFELHEVTAGRMALLDRTDGSIGFQTEPHPDVDFVSCKGLMEGTAPKGEGKPSNTVSDSIPIPNWYMLPPNLPFARVIQLANGAPSLPMDTILEETVTVPRDTTCYVFNASGRRTDAEPCTLTIRDTLPASLAYSRVWSINWPSGAQTTLAAGAGWNTEDGQIIGPVAINGQRGDWTGPPEGSGLSWELVQCLRNPVSGNTFCYER